MSPDPDSPAGDLVRLTAAALWKQAELLLAELQALEQAAAELDAAARAAAKPTHTDVAALVRRHSLDCLIKLEWAAHAIVMYRRELALDGRGRAPEPPV